ncbi:GAF domain-containing protein [Hymenobacter yonginensis]|uniref:GAF domain-containing protein n=1 Tax=Hymenobacter yonginensis TaxID=748197 RepID=A0ABY7PSZ6_9BACT|nr:GAF domain-containing protein [Hymenobacter yonginensis]WBO85729.1 GAF domain-containing protein [Hymenobacter yonginensis]
MTTTLPTDVRRTLAAETAPAAALTQVLELVGQALAADRCFLYVRDPAAGRGRIALCWRRHTDIPNPIHDWQDDTTALPQEDPLFRAALAAKPSVFVEDVETAPPTVLNRAFEHKTFGHRALIHAHITEHGQLWGILQPCLFGQPRAWTADERAAIESILPLLVAPIKAYMQTVTTI